jgi:hypothetical protein
MTGGSCPSPTNLLAMHQSRFLLEANHLQRWLKALQTHLEFVIDADSVSSDSVSDKYFLSACKDLDGLANEWDTLCEMKELYPKSKEFSDKGAKDLLDDCDNSLAIVQEDLTFLDNSSEDDVNGSKDNLNVSGSGLADDEGEDDEDLFAGFSNPLAFNSSDSGLGYHFDKCETLVRYEKNVAREEKRREKNAVVEKLKKHSGNIQIALVELKLYCERVPVKLNKKSLPLLSLGRSSSAPVSSLLRRKESSGSFSSWSVPSLPSPSGAGLFSRASFDLSPSLSHSGSNISLLSDVSSDVGSPKSARLQQHKVVSMFSADAASLAARGLVEPQPKRVESSSSVASSDGKVGQSKAPV